MSHWAVEEFGHEILTKTGAKKTEEVLGGKKLIAIYFSAHWCPPCRGFTPVLVDFYNAVKAHNPDDLEIVFVSSDQDQGAFDGYFGSMTFTALPFSERDRKQIIGDKYAVRGIPTFIVLDGATGEVIDASARGIVTEHAAHPEKAISHWCKH